MIQVATAFIIPDSQLTLGLLREAFGLPNDGIPVVVRFLNASGEHQQDHN
jgi:hypothetical protein